MKHKRKFEKGFEKIVVPKWCPTFQNRTVRSYDEK